MSEMTNSFSALDWLEGARKDWHQIEERLRDNECADAAFMLHQSLEKYLKGYVVSRDWELKHSHNLADLLIEIVQHEPNYEEFQELCEEISEYYFLEWNPSPEKVPSREKVGGTVEQARILVDRILSDIQV